MSEENNLSVILFGIHYCESWALLKEDISRLVVAEMWFCRRMTKTSWAEEKRNEDVLREIQTDIYGDIKQEENLTL